ncbi:MAG: hypothetical protein HY296_07515 [Thaumarchaeota archaeon]|nr:hypothetical protein [Nitrososphaerota archaeon]
MSRVASNVSIAVYFDHKVIANITTESDWRTFGYSMTPNNKTKTSGPLACSYLGVPYSNFGNVGFCSFNSLVESNNMTIPQGGCVLPRNESRS